LWQITGAPVLSADGSTVYVGSTDSSLYAVSTADGQQKWAFPTKAQVRAIPPLSTPIDPSRPSLPWVLSALLCSLLCSAISVTRALSHAPLMVLGGAP